MSLADVCCRCEYMLFPGLSMCVTNQSKFPRGPGVFPSFWWFPNGTWDNISICHQQMRLEKKLPKKVDFCCVSIKNISVTPSMKVIFFSCLILSQNYGKKKHVEAIILHYKASQWQISLQDHRKESYLMSWSVGRGEIKEGKGEVFICAQIRHLKMFWHLLNPGRNVETDSNQPHEVW